MGHGTRQATQRCARKQVSLSPSGRSASSIESKNCTNATPCDASLRRPARQAIAEIQARLGGAAPGQLSLAGAEAGQLAMVEDDEAGRLSLSDDARA